MARRRKKTQRMGFVDYCRVDNKGHVICADSANVKGAVGDKLRDLVGDEKWLPRHDDKRRCIKWKPDLTLTKLGKKSAKDCLEWEASGRQWSKDIEGRPRGHGTAIADMSAFKDWPQYGSPIFTSTSKVHAPTWGITAGHTCPRVREPILRWVKQMMDMPKDAEIRQPEYVVKKLSHEIPRKCHSCYATGGNYLQPEVKRAMANREVWWNKASDKEAIETMVFAIQHAGDEHCTEGGGCKFVPGVQAKYFRAFDSGDFQNPRDIRRWREIASRLPGTKFWFPTTTAEGVCGAPASFSKAMIAELRKLQSVKTKNVIVRPSAQGLDIAAAEVPGLGKGTAVVDKKQVMGDPKTGKPKRIYGTGRNERWVDLCDINDKNCRKHYVCPGDCSTCRMCWSDRHPVVYLRHGPLGSAKSIYRLIRKTTGTEAINPGMEKIVGPVHKAIQGETEKLLGQMWQGPTNEPPGWKKGWVKAVEGATPMLPGNVERALRKQEVEARKAARETAKK